MTQSFDDSPNYEPTQATLIRLWLVMIVLGAAVGLVALVRLAGATIAAAMARRA